MEAYYRVFLPGTIIDTETYHEALAVYEQLPVVDGRIAGGIVELDPLPCFGAI